MLKKNLIKRVQILKIILFLFVSSIFAAAQTLEKPVEGKAKVYVMFFGTMAFYPRSIPIPLFIDKKYVGDISSSHMKGLNVEPGESVLWAKTLNKKRFIKLDVKAGKTYFVQIKMVAKPYDPIPIPALYNANPGYKKGKKRFKAIKKRLNKSKFTVQIPETEELLNAYQTRHQSVIDEVWVLWESKWQKEKRWQKIGPDHGSD